MSSNLLRRRKNWTEKVDHEIMDDSLIHDFIVQFFRPICPPPQQIGRHFRPFFLFVKSSFLCCTEKIGRKSPSNFVRRQNLDGIPVQFLEMKNWTEKLDDIYLVPFRGGANTRLKQDPREGAGRMAGRGAAGQGYWAGRLGRAAGQCCWVRLLGSAAGQGCCWAGPLARVAGQSCWAGCWAGLLGRVAGQWLLGSG